MNPDADTIIYQDQGKSQHAFLNLYILQATPAVLSKVWRKFSRGVLQARNIPYQQLQS